LLLESIRKQEGKPFEIIICGDTENYKDEKGVVLVDRKKEAHSRQVALLRNKAAEISKYNVLAWCDDDIILDPDWLKNTVSYTEKSGWEILGNKVLCPDGTRYWDRATLEPHCLVEYDTSEGMPNLYQSSAFFIMRKSVWEKVKWDETKLVYADREDKIPEDVQYSMDLKNAGYVFHFNKETLVWHYDEAYTEFSAGNGMPTQTLKKDFLKEHFNLSFFLPRDDAFNELVGEL